VTGGSGAGSSSQPRLGVSRLGRLVGVEGGDVRETDYAEARRQALLAGESQLEMQTARSAALDGGALGVMAVDAGVAAIIIGARGAYGLWIVALVLVGLTFRWLLYNSYAIDQVVVQAEELAFRRLSWRLVLY